MQEFAKKAYADKWEAFKQLKAEQDKLAACETRIEALNKEAAQLAVEIEALRRQVRMHPVLVAGHSVQMV